VSKSNLDQFARIITNNSKANYSYLPQYGNGAGPLFTNPNRFDDLIRTYINSAGQVDASFNMNALNNAPSADLDDLRKIVVDGEMTATHTGLPSVPASRARFNTAMNKYINDVALFENGTPPGTGTTGGAGATNNVYDLSRTDVDGFKSVIKTETAEMDKSIKVLEDKIKAIEKNEARSKLNPRKVRVDPNKVQIGNKAARKASSDITNLNSKITSIKAEKAKLTSLSSELDKAFNPTTGRYDIPKSVADDFKSFNGTSKIATASKSAKWVRGVGGFARGLGCGLLGNWAGIRSLQDDGMTNLNYSINFKDDVTFEKNIVYVANMEYIAPLAGAYDSRYVVDIAPFNSQDPSVISSMPSTRIDSCAGN